MQNSWPQFAQKRRGPGTTIPPGVVNQGASNIVACNLFLATVDDATCGLEHSDAAAQPPALFQASPEDAQDFGGKRIQNTLLFPMLWRVSLSGSGYICALRGEYSRVRHPLVLNLGGYAEAATALPGPPNQPTPRAARPRARVCDTQLGNSRLGQLTRPVSQRSADRKNDTSARHGTAARLAAAAQYNATA